LKLFQRALDHAFIGAILPVADLAAVDVGEDAMGVELIGIGLESALRFFNGVFHAAGGEVEFGNVFDEKIGFGIFFHRQAEILDGFV
jgi:hypothetical protein